MVNKKAYKFNPDYVVPPGETLLETLECLGMSQAELAERTGRPKKTINEIINGKAAITPDTALQLEKVLGAPASFWNNLERNYREKLAEIKEREYLQEEVSHLKQFPLNAMIKFGWLRKCDDKIEQLKEVLTFFGAASIQAWEKYLASRTGLAFRKTTTFESEDIAVATWIRKGEIEAQKVSCNPFNEKKFRAALEEIRSLTTKPIEHFLPRLLELCSEAGVVVVFIPELPKSRVSGATLWMGDKALILLSLRYKTDDHLWFTFFHEAGHILLHGKREIFLESKENNSEKEEEANKFSTDMLIPPQAYKKFVSKGVFNAGSITSFADSIGISPGIVVGRLQHDKLLRFATVLNGLKQRFEWSFD